MEAEQEQPSESSRPRGIGPGERLQAARIKKGLSVDDVANRMHLSTSILEAIEDNNFEEITAPIFVKGYLRAYARIVELNENEMISQYLEMYSEEDPPISTTSNMVPELSSTDTRIKWTTYFVIALLGILLAAWWWNKQQNPEAPVSLDVQAPTTAEIDDSDGVVDSAIEAGSESNGSLQSIAQDSGQGNADSAAETVVTASQALGESTPTENPDTEIAMQTGGEADESVDAGAEAETTVETMAAGESSQGATDSVVVEVELSETGAATQTSAGEVASTQTLSPESATGTRERPGRTAPNGSDRLRIVVHADTWADVKDANNYQLVYDLLRADSSVLLTGQAPFSVFLGNGHGVEVRFNGAEIGFSSRIRADNTARLNVGG